MGTEWQRLGSTGQTAGQQGGSWPAQEGAEGRGQEERKSSGRTQDDGFLIPTALVGGPGWAEAETLRDLIPHQNGPRGTSAHCVLGAEGRKDSWEADLWLEVEPFL